MMGDMLLKLDAETLRRDMADSHGPSRWQVARVEPAAERPGCTSLSCRLRSRAGRALVRWGWRLQDGIPAVVIMNQSR